MTACGTTDYSDLQGSSSTFKLTWKIKHIVCQCTEDDNLIVNSPEFNFSHGTWGLSVRPFIKYGPDRFVDIYVRNSTDFDQTQDVFFKIGLRDSEGRIQYTFESTEEFKDIGDWGGPNDGIIRRDILEEKRRELMPDDILTVVCELRTSEDFKQELGETDSCSSTSSHIDSLITHMGALLKEQKNCDVTLHLGDKEFYAHKYILGARSPVFAAMFEHDLQENRTNSVTIQDIEPSDFGVVLDYVYTAKVQELSIKQAIGIYAAADKYDLKELKSYCRDTLLSEFSIDWFFDITVLADAYNDGKLMDGMKLFARKNSSTIYSSDKCQEFFLQYPKVAFEIARSAASGFKAKS